jgi:hypothetical protein
MKFTMPVNNVAAAREQSMDSLMELALARSDPADAYFLVAQVQRFKTVTKDSNQTDMPIIKLEGGTELIYVSPNQFACPVVFVPKDNNSLFVLNTTTVCPN